MSSLFQDVRHAFRSIRYSPGFYGLVLGILALGIGASVSVFSLVDGVVLRPLPYHDPSRLVALQAVATKPPFESNGSVTYTDFEQFQAQARSFESVAVMYRSGFGRVTLSEGDVRERVSGGFVSPNFFDLFGRAPILGRTFTPEENLHAEHVVLVSEGLAARRFGSAADALGRDLQMSGAKWRIIGVMPADFRVPFLDSQIWAPIMSNPYWNDKVEPDARRKSERWDLMARLKPGATLASAQADVDTIYSRLRDELPDAHSDRVLAVPLREYFTGKARRPFTILLGSVAFLLLIACANVGNLLLARATARQREYAIRAALGAGVARLLRQALAETMTLCIIAGALGVALSFALVHVLKVFAPAWTPRLNEVGIDSRVLLFAIALSLAAGLCLGLALVWKSLHQPADSLHTAGRSATASRESRKLKNVLVAAEFALAMVLLTGSALLIRSFVAALGVDLGFRPEHLLTLRVETPDMPAPQVSEFYRQAMERIRSLPGIEAVGAASGVFKLDVTRTHALRIVEGRPDEPVEKWQALEWAQISGDYFQAMSIPLLRGRYFGERDGPDAPPVVIVNETLARRYWPNEDPIGKRLKGMDPRGPNAGKNDDWLTVVGVVKDMRTGGRERQPFSQIFEVQAQRGETTGVFVIRATADPMQLAAAVRAAIRDTNRSATIASMSTMERVLEDQQVERRFQTWLISVFSAIALALAALGVFAVMHFMVAAKTREIGIRVAVGARAADILQLVIRDGARLAMTGIAIGVLASAWTTQALASMLFEIKPTDPASFISAAAILLAVAVAACYLPARRAAHLDPVVALRAE